GKPFPATGQAEQIWHQNCFSHFYSEIDLSHTLNAYLSKSPCFLLAHSIQS
uniref:Uncharacterized protein n=1 Tax=Anopheles quadriannulatus TaxID=34691 RepID=A0A182XSD2_ANOQN